MRRLLVTFVFLAVLLGAASSARAQSSGDLEKAYKREFAFLEAEKNTLKRRLADVEADGQKKVESARGEVDALQGRVLALSTEADQLNDLLLDTERKAETTEEGTDTIDNMLQQAAALLEKGDAKLPEAKEGDRKQKLEHVGFAFDKAIDLLGRWGAVRKTKGEFFTSEGKKIEGDVLRIGRVASYGVSNEAAGALAPAGGDRLQIWPLADSAGVARALVGGSGTNLLKMFLYESTEKGVEAKDEKTVREIIDSGGVIGWVIVGSGAVAALMILLRALILLFASSNTRSLVDRVSPLVEGGKLKEAVKLCASKRGSAARVIKKTLESLTKPREQLEDAISEAVLHETPKLDRFGAAILVIAAVAPLLGLLGTVTGMIATFDIITEFGTGNPKLLSGGISVALVTTELGLVVAIPALLGGNLLSGWAESIKDDMDTAALRITNIATGVRTGGGPISVAPEEPDDDDNDAEEARAAS